MGFLPPVVMELRAKAGEVHAELAKVTTETRAMVAETETGSAKMSAAYKGAAGAGKALALGIVGGAAVIGGFSIEAAAAAQVTEAKLSVAIKNAGGNMDQLEPKIAAAQESMRKYGFSNDEAKDAIGTLTTALGDPKKALADVGLAADLARAKHITLSEASLLVAKTAEGQVRGLKALGIDLPVAASGAAKVAAAQAKLADAQAKANAIAAETPTKLKDVIKQHNDLKKAQDAVAAAQANVTAKSDAGAQLLDGLKSRISGAANAYKDTLQGQLTAFRSNVENLGEKIGGKLIPILESAIKSIQDMGKWLNANRPAAIAIASVIGVVVVGAIGAWISSLIVAGVESTKAFAGMIADAVGWSAKTIAAGAKWLAAQAAQFGAWLAKQAAVIASAAPLWGQYIAMQVSAGAKSAAVWVATSAKTVASFVATNAAMVAQKAIMIAGAVATGVATAAQWALNAAMDANPIGIIIVAIAALIAGLIWFFTQTKLGKEIWKNVTDFIVAAVQNIGKWFSDVFNAIGGFVSGAFKGVGNFIVGVFNHIIDLVNGVIAGLNGIAGGLKNLTGGAINFTLGKIPHLPSFDVGGIVPGPTGKPVMAVVHGGEPILSAAMLAGRAPIPQQAVDAVNRQQGNGSSGSQVHKHFHATVNATTNASPQRIASDIGWVLKRMG